MTAERARRIIVIGAGQAGGEFAQRLRALDATVDITMIGEEPDPPYQRPPLSKKYLSGELARDRLWLRPPETYAQERIALITGRRAVWIDRSAKRVRLEGGQELAYDALVLATGARPRRLLIPGADLKGVHVVRTLGDVDAMRPAFQPGANLIVIGAGYIGLEVAAIGRGLGLNVSVLEAAARPLARVACPEVSGFYLEQHVQQGVAFMLSAQAAVLKGEASVRGVVLADGRDLPADLVLIGIGIIPETTLAEQSGLAVDNGVLTNLEARTNDPAIFAIGDCARRPMPLFGNRLERLESVYNAIEGAKIAAAAVAGQPAPPPETPWNWSDQYDLKLQSAGLMAGYDQIVMRGDPAERAFAAFYLREGQLIAVDAINRPAEFLGAKLLLQKGKTPPLDALADPQMPMKTLVSEA